MFRAGIGHFSALQPNETRRMMDEITKLNLMKEAILEARKSRAEDDRAHPLVGAILTDERGNILLRAFRGEHSDGAHAEFTLVQKAERTSVDLRGTTLFVTLEPCTRRGPGKTPCAIRIAESGIKRVYIGTMDPNPNIIGRGELHLTVRGLEVERFPYSLAKELYEINEDFFTEHLHYVAPVVSIHSETGGHTLSGNRESLLQASLDLIISSSEPVWIFSGASSWVRELQVGLLYAALKGREIKILCEGNHLIGRDFEMAKAAAIGAGAQIAIVGKQTGIRGTLVAPLSDDAAMICIERQPSLHALKFTAPHEQGVLGAMGTLFSEEWSKATAAPSRAPEIDALSLEFVRSALSSRIQAYRNASFQRVDIPVKDLFLLPKNIERFKLFRLGVLEEIRSQHPLPEMGFIRGSPWPYLLPIVERAPDGKTVVIDGAHRVFYAIQKGRPELPVILIENVEAELPAQPIENLDDIRVTSEKLRREQRYTAFNPAAFRPIQRALEDELWERFR
jgi:pyrimidine deaminase RibD-like protein